MNLRERCASGFHDPGSNRVLDFLLDQAAEIPCTVDSGVSLFHQPGRNGFVPGKDQITSLHDIPDLVQHQHGDVREVLLCQAVEADHFIHAVQELRTQELTERLERAFTAHVADRTAEADRRGFRVASGIGGHDDDRVLKVHCPPLGIGDMSVVQDLQQDIHHVRMRLLDFVEENDGIGFAADLFGELAGLVVADIAGRRTDNAGDGELLHKLGHIQPDQALRAVEHVGGEPLDQFGLSDAGSPHKDKADRFALDLESDTAAADCRTDRVHRLVLTDDMLLQPGVKAGQALQLVLFDGGSRDFGPELDDASQIIHGQFGSSLGIEHLLLLAEAEFLAAQFRDACIAGFHLLLGIRVVPTGVIRQQCIRFETDVLQFTLHLHPAVDVRVLEIHIRARLVQEVDGLVGEEAVRDIALTHGDGLLAHVIRDLHTVVVLIVMRDAAENRDAVFNGRLIHRHRLEPALQCGVFFNMLAVLGEGRGTDHLDLTAGEGGLEDIRRVHAALGVPGSDDGMHFIDHQDDVSLLSDLLDQALHAAFKLSAELGPGHQGSQVQKKDLFILQLVRHVSHGDALGQALGNRRLADTGFADQAGIVLLPAVQDLDHTFQFLVPADHGVELSGPGTCGQVDAVVVQVFPLSVFSIGRLI